MRLLVALVLLSAAELAHSQAHEEGTAWFDCHGLAGLVSTATNYRDAGANLQKTIRLFVRKLKPPKGHAVVLELEIRRAWREGLNEDDAGFAVFTRCIKEEGRMPVPKEAM